MSRDTFFILIKMMRDSISVMPLISQLSRQAKCADCPSTEGGKSEVCCFANSST